MTYLELQASFELEINKIDANLEKPKSVDIEYWLNRGLEKFYKTRYTGSNPKGLGFEQDQKRIDDLRTLICTKHCELDEETWYLNQENTSDIKLSNQDKLLLESMPIDKIYAASNNKFYIRLPKDYVFLLGDTSSIIPIDNDDLKCAKRDNDGNIIPWRDDTIEATIETVDKQFRNTLSEHKIKYNRARPLRLIQENVITLITDGNYTVSEYSYSYLRRPNEINIHKNPREMYTDMPEHTHSEIVSLAVQLYLENQKDNRYTTYSNEVTTIE